MSLCLDPAVAARDKQWWGLVWQVQSEVGLAREYGAVEQGKMLAQCDAARDAGACLKAAYASAIEGLRAQEQAWKVGITEPGDAQTAARLIGAIEGTYQHRIESGLVDGTTYTATDELSISRASDSSIQFNVHLNFYNGHECNFGGTAEFKQNGHFVHTEKLDSGKTCLFEIVPGSTDIRINDPTGTCRELSCGVRGGYNGASFSLSWRK